MASEPSTLKTINCNGIAEICYIVSDGFNFDSLEALQKWKDREGSEATYGKLLTVFTQAGYQSVASSICKILRKKCKPRSKFKH